MKAKNYRKDAQSLDGITVDLNGVADNDALLYDAATNTITPIAIATSLSDDANPTLSADLALNAHNIDTGTTTITPTELATLAGAASNLQLQLDAKEPVITKNTAFNKDFGTTTGTVCAGNDSRLSDARTPLTHTHVSSEVIEDTKLFFTNDRADARITLQKGVASGIATLGADQKIPSSQIPAIAITDTYVVASEAEQLALTVQQGDVCVRTDLGSTYINSSGNNTSITDWIQLASPSDAPVTSVNGDTGSVVLTTSDINEGTNLYYTDARVGANTTVAANTAARHTHSNQSILDNSTASFTSELATKLDGVEVGATADQSASDVPFAADGDIASTNVQTAIVEVRNDTDAKLSNKSNIGHTHVTSEVTEDTNLYYTDGRVSANSDVVANTNARHTHTNKTILDNVTAPFTTEEETKLSGIEAGATADQIASEVPFTADGDIAATDVQNAIVEVRDDTDTKLSGKSDTIHTHVGGDVTSAVNEAAYAVSASACTGNAATATKLATAKTISLTGDVIGSASFDGSANAAITATVADDSHNHIIANVDGLQTAIDATLPLSGGTMTGILSFPSSAGDKIRLYGSTYGLGVNSSELTLYTGGVVRVRQNAWNGAVLGTVWHSGNDGSGSGLDADLIDGKHASNFMVLSEDGAVVGTSFKSTHVQTTAGSTITVKSPAASGNISSLASNSTHTYGTYTIPANVIEGSHITISMSCSNENAYNKALLNGVAVSNLSDVEVQTGDVLTFQIYTTSISINSATMSAIITIGNYTTILGVIPPSW